MLRRFRRLSPVIDPHAWPASLARITVAHRPRPLPRPCRGSGSHDAALPPRFAMPRASCPGINAGHSRQAVDSHAGLHRVGVGHADLKSFVRRLHIRPAIAIQRWTACFAVVLGRFVRVE